jgi:uncharacterized membrane protein YfcA
LALLILVVALISGGVAMLSGFGIGSLLTPVFSLFVDTKAAVAAVSLPHAIATASRLWLLRAHVDRRMVWTFGLTSAAGGLLGALLHTRASSPALARVFGALLVLAGLSQLTGLSDRWRFRGLSAWLAGGVSGFFGGLVGNQGGIRSAAMLGLDLSKDQFVATGAAIALLVDLVRVPIYLASESVAVAALVPQLLVATAGCIVGTFLGGEMLLRLPPRRFRTIVAVTILLLGIGMLVESASGV